MHVNADELFRRLQTSKPDLPPEVISAFSGPAGKNIDRFLFLAIKNKRLNAQMVLNAVGPLPGIEEFVKSLTELKESSRRVYESRLRTYAHHSKYFLPQLPRTSRLLHDDPEFIRAAMKTLGDDASEQAVIPVTKRFALVFSSPESSLVLTDLGRDADREWFSERRSRFSTSSSAVVRVQTANKLLSLAATLGQVVSTNDSLKSLLAQLRCVPEVISVHADTKQALLSTIDEAVSDLNIQAQLLQKGE